MTVSPSGVVFLNESNNTETALSLRAQLEKNGWKVHCLRGGSVAINGIFIDQKFFTLNEPSLEFQEALVQEGYSPAVIYGFSHIAKEFRGASDV